MIKTDIGLRLPWPTSKIRKTTMEVTFITLVQIVTPIVVAIFASNGFWTVVQQRKDDKSARTKLIMGLGTDKIFYLGGRYIERGYITRAEYADFRRYFYDPYKELGGNGLAEKVMNEINKLPLKERHSGKLPTKERDLNRLALQNNDIYGPNLTEEENE